MGLLSAKLPFFFQSMAFVAAVIPFIDRYTSLSAYLGLDRLGDQQLPMSELERGFLLPLPVVFVLMGIFAYLITTIVVVIFTLIKYYGFGLRAGNGTLHIEYGLITEKKYALPLKKISGVKYKQSLLMRIFGYVKLEIMAVGYGNESGNTGELALLYPLIKLKEANSFVASLIPGFSLEYEFEKPEPRAFLYFYIRPEVFICLGITVLALIFGHLLTKLVAGAILLLVLASKTLEFFSTAGHCDTGILALSTGGFSKETIFIKMEKMEMLSEKAGYFKGKKQVTSIRANFFGPVSQNKAKARNLSMNFYENAKGKLVN